MQLGNLGKRGLYTVEIKTDEEYFAVLRKIVTGAEYIDPSKLSPEKYRRAMERYEELCQMAHTYRGNV
jgi:hypothetical protein